MIKYKAEDSEEHCCDSCQLPLDKYLQLGSNQGRRLLVVGESPADNWLKSGRAFFTMGGKIVPTGKNFLINLKQIDSKLDLENISFTEISKCFVAGNRKKLHVCAAKTWSHFIEQLNYVQPKLIILLGQKTTEIFNYIAATSLTLGYIQKVGISGKKHYILPLYHPSPLNPKRVKNDVFVKNNRTKIRELLMLH